jgi:Pyruvate/2-oxoglutarate dehydrogenase complex, dehydrogenase (E1) component, eukaryotic type, alpha subunit
MKLVSLYKKILRIRKIELKISQEYSKGNMRCPVHLSIGQEAPAVGICSNLNFDDQLLSSHRSHAHYLAKGGNLKKMISEIYGKITGTAKGKGGSMHLSDLKAGIVASVPIVGSTLPIATGIAWSNKLRKKKNIVVIFFGDGATEEGVFQESLDFASLHNLKILFVCENNFYSVYSSLKYRQNKKRNLISFAKALGLDTYKIEGNDVNKISLSSKKIIKNIKKKNKPAFIMLDTYRWLEHCGPN